MLAYLRKGETFAELAARAPKLRRALRDARKAGHACLVIDGTLIPLTTVGDMTQCMPPLLDHYRADLDAQTLTARRGAFLSAALTQLDS